MILVLLASLIFTAPADDRTMTWRLIQNRQSKIWIDMHVEMERYPRLWQLLWHRVRREAKLEYIVVKSGKATSRERVTIENVPLGTYRVIVCDDQWNCSPPSNFIGVR